MIRWPGKIKAGSISNEIIQHHDWLPTFLAAAGDADIVEKLKKGHQAGDPRRSAQRHGQAVAGLVARGRVVAVHRRAGPGGQQHGLGLNEPVGARAHVDEQHAGNARAVGRGDQLDGAVLLELLDIHAPDLLHEPVDDLDAGQVGLVDGAVEALARECLGVQRAIGIAVEEAADLVLELAYPLDGALDQAPCQVLARQPLAAFDGVHEVTLHRVASRQRDVVAALHHARAAALAEQALDRDGHAQLGVRLLGMQRGEQPGATGAEHQDVCLVIFDLHVRSLPQ